MRAKLIGAQTPKKPSSHKKLFRKSGKGKVGEQRKDHFDASNFKKNQNQKKVVKLERANGGYLATQRR